MPRDTLTAEAIVRAAIDLLDAEGLDGLNMRSLGHRLESAATAIYWHVKTKDELVRRAGDAIWDEVVLPDLEATDWRSAAIALAEQTHAMLTRHPWYVQAFGSYLLTGAGKARIDEYNLAVFEKAGFAPADADRAAATVLLFVLGNALSPAAEVSLTRRLNKNGNAEQRMAEVMREATEIARSFPRLRKRLETQAGEDYVAAPEGAFEFGLRAIIDGLAAELDRQT